MKKLFIVVLLIVGLLIPGVSAEVLYDEHIEYYNFTGGRGTGFTYGSGLSGQGTFANLYIPDITKVGDISYVVVETPATTLHPEGRQEFTYVIDGKTKTATMHTSYIRNILQLHTKTRYTFFFNDWDNVDMVGSRTISTPILFKSLRHYSSQNRTGDSPIWLEGDADGTYTITASCGIYFQNDIKISSLDYGNTIAVSLKRIINSQIFPSTLIAYNNDTEVYNSYGIMDDDVRFLARDITTIKLETPGETYVYPITSVVSPPDAIPIDIRVQNSQTGALLAGAHINITASVDGEFHEVVNETLPAGTKTYYLQPTGGGLPNPDFYRLIATVEGYNPIMPYIDFEADIATTIYAYMNPIGGAPVNENKTFIDFYVRDLNAKPVAGATVKFGAYTLLTNSAGYTIFEVDKDKLYVWTVSKAGYGSVTGNAVIGSDARYTINAVIAPVVTPTLTTPIPTSPTVKPTPTLTSPTGEPVSNLLEWAAAHFGMLLGGGVEIGKIFMWLCFTIPAGVYVGKESKAGAAGFMAGAGIVTLFFVIIGWVPVWLVVILALIIGLLYAKAFSNIGNGGGR